MFDCEYNKSSVPLWIFSVFDLTRELVAKTRGHV